MASIESRDRRRTKSLKTSPSSSTSLVNKLSSSKAIEVQRIITRDGFGYFPMSND